MSTDSLAAVTKAAEHARENKGRQANKDRDDAIRSAIFEGHAVPEVAVAAGISPIRVRQIAPMSKFGGKTFQAKQANRAEKRAAAKAPKAKVTQAAPQAAVHQRAEQGAVVESVVKVEKVRVRKWTITDPSTREVRYSDSDKVAEKAREMGMTVARSSKRAAA